jgi:hypothetical protein
LQETGPNGIFAKSRFGNYTTEKEKHSMSSDLSPYLGNKVLRWMNNDAAMPSSPASLWVSLWNGNPKAGGTEISGTISAGGRQQVTFTSLASGVNHLLTSSAAADFGNAAGAASLSHIGLHDSHVGGNLLASKAAAGGPLSILVGTGVKFLAGAITFNVGSDT